MQTAAHQLRGQVERLVLIEPSPFYLLDIPAHREAFCEISSLAEYTCRCIANRIPEAAAERFIDYWCGAGTWTASSADRQAAFARSIGLLLAEWSALLVGQNTLTQVDGGTSSRHAGNICESVVGCSPGLGVGEHLQRRHMAPRLIRGGKSMQ